MVVLDQLSAHSTRKINRQIKQKQQQQPKCTDVFNKLHLKRPWHTFPSDKAKAATTAKMYGCVQQVTPEKTMVHILMWEDQAAEKAEEKEGGTER